MEFSEIIFLIIGSLFLLFGIATTIYPKEIRRWLKTHSYLSDESFYCAGYIISLIGLVILIITFWDSSTMISEDKRRII
ncbi:MAG: hypothetical protein KAT74_00210 [Candidatus Cloacimonetes bacterium]|nr:hypothetical protein [Candidatus Cloacimonadota bacterium]